MGSFKFKLFLNKGKMPLHLGQTKKESVGVRKEKLINSRLRPTDAKKLTDVEIWLSPAAGPCRASPKSESFALKSSSRRIFDGLKSRNIN